MASYLGLSKKFLPNLKQYEATTGRPISDRAMQNYLYAALQTEADRKDTAYARERQFGFQQAGLDIQKQAIADQKSAAKISGITQLAGLPIQGALGYGVLKQAGLIGSKVAPTVPAGVSAAEIGTAAGTNFVSPTMAWSPYGNLTSQGLLSGGTGSGGAQALLNTPTTFGGTAAGAGNLAVGTGATASTAAAAPTGAGLLGTIAPYAVPAGVGFLGAKLLGGPLDKILPGGGKTGRVVGETAGGALAGWAAGAAIGSGAGPIGAVIGGVVGFISSLF